MGCRHFGFQFGLCVIAAILSLPSATAARFEVRNEITKYPGRNRRVTIKCWSANDDLGTHVILPGQAKRWSFEPVSVKIPFLYTKFECDFKTFFNSPEGQKTVVFEGGMAFRWECDQPRAKECIWVVKRDGLFLRKIVRDKTDRPRYSDELKLQWLGGTNYFAHEDDS
ncbi:PREDICTED: uncharacterized protein LOC104811243 [Tarenaya hassleriana]|uniref:uncharacterized protein LOC104811243 n=1 Tax=Tarenaya hassleriana TaxID=28532 RepID=UPI00053C0A39|nr:PREDICTED: uncharacterized protein LOC104811243 [Tarenaya hassleriana]